MFNAGSGSLSSKCRETKLNREFTREDARFRPAAVTGWTRDVARRRRAARLIDVLYIYGDQWSVVREDAALRCSIA